MSKGNYIVIEGLDGCGKTTQYRQLMSYLGKSAVGVREPGSTPVSEAIRKLLIDKAIPRDPAANVFLFAAARADLMSNVIRPAIQAGNTVVSDRNWLSSAAYQTAEGVLLQDILAINKLATKEFFEPDLVLFIDVEPATCRDRIVARGHDAGNYFEVKGLQFFENARELYLQQVRALRHGVIISGEQAIEQVWADIQAVVAVL